LPFYFSTRKTKLQGFHLEELESLEYRNCRNKDGTKHRIHMNFGRLQNRASCGAFCVTAMARVFKDMKFDIASSDYTNGNAAVIVTSVARYNADETAFKFGQNAVSSSLQGRAPVMVL
jgi:hypothetical protein